MFTALVMTVKAYPRQYEACLFYKFVVKYFIQEDKSGNDKTQHTEFPKALLVILLILSI
jgi:hypothetical protein